MLWPQTIPKSLKMRGFQNTSLTQINSLGALLWYFHTSQKKHKTTRIHEFFSVKIWAMYHLRLHICMISFHREAVPVLLFPLQSSVPRTSHHTQVLHYPLLLSLVSSYPSKIQMGLWCSQVSWWALCSAASMTEALWFRKPSPLLWAISSG